jgi:formylglycine-generating enzyme required for sulfatase activity
VKTEPVKTEPVKTEPVKTEPVKTEPVKTEPVKTEPVKTEPVKTEPVKTEPVKTDPVKTDPVKTDPVKTEPDIPSAVPVDPGKSSTPDPAHPVVTTPPVKANLTPGARREFTVRDGVKVACLQIDERRFISEQPVTLGEYVAMLKAVRNGLSDVYSSKQWRSLLPQKGDLASLIRDTFQEAPKPGAQPHRSSDRKPALDELLDGKHPEITARTLTGITAREAQEFAGWLEVTSGGISIRLPTDQELSWAAEGLPALGLKSTDPRPPEIVIQGFEFKLARNDGTRIALDRCDPNVKIDASFHLVITTKR